MRYERSMRKIKTCVVLFKSLVVNAYHDQIKIVGPGLLNTSVKSFVYGVMLWVAQYVFPQLMAPQTDTIKYRWRAATITQSSIIPNITGCAINVALYISLKYFFVSISINSQSEMQYRTRKTYFFTVFFSCSSLNNSKNFEQETLLVLTMSTKESKNNRYSRRLSYKLAAHELRRQCEVFVLSRREVFRTSRNKIKLQHCLLTFAPYSNNLVWMMVFFYYLIKVYHKIFPRRQSVIYTTGKKILYFKSITKIFCLLK